MRDLERRDLVEFELRPNHLSRILYQDVNMPGHTDHPHPAFIEADFQKFEWDRDGELSDDKNLFGGSMKVTLGVLERGYATGDAVTRWPAANPQLANTTDDCFAKAIARIRQAIGPKAPQTIRENASSVLLLLMKRR